MDEQLNAVIAHQAHRVQAFGHLSDGAVKRCVNGIPGGFDAAAAAQNGRCERFVRQLLQRDDPACGIITVFFSPLNFVSAAFLPPNSLSKKPISLPFFLRCTQRDLHLNKDIILCRKLQSASCTKRRTDV